MAAAASASANPKDAPLTETITTPLTKMFGIKHPIILAGTSPSLSAPYSLFLHLSVLYVVWRDVM
jgi:hypothetical protein